MIESVATLLSVYLLTWHALVAFVFLGVAFEHTGNRKSSIFSGLMVMGISYFFFDVSLSTIWAYLFAYFVVGVSWSFWRYRRHVTQKVSEFSGKVWKKREDLESDINSLSPSKNLDLITTWIIVWPFSVLANLLSDIITIIQALVTKVFKSVYHKIFVAQTETLRNQKILD